MIKEDVLLNGNNIAVKGKATIQLFDTKGDVVSEVVKNNYVSPRYLRVISKLTPYNAVYTNGYTWLTPHKHEYQSSYGRYGYVHGGLILTNNANPASPETDRYIEGKHVAYGFLGQASGTSTLKGTYNTTESILSAFYRKMVYDFTTSQGNGTFQSIYTGLAYYESKWYNNSSYEMGYIKVPVQSGHTLFYSTRVLPYNGYLVYLTYSGSKVYLNKIKVTNISAFHAEDGYNRTLTDEIESHEVVETGFPKDYWSENSFEIYNGVMYLANGDGKLYKASMSDLTSATQMGTFTEPVNQSVSIFYSETLGKLVISNAYRGYMNFFSLDGTKGTEYTQNTTMGSDLGYGAWREYPAGSGWVKGKDYVWDLKTMSKVHSLPQADYGFIPMNDDYCMYLNSRGYIAIKPNQHFFSRVALDSPVTKTAQQTMKITYEFNIEPYPLNIDYTKVK